MGRHRFEFVNSSGSSVCIDVKYQCEGGVVSFAKILTGFIDGREIGDFESFKTLQAWNKQWPDTIECDEEAGEL